MTLLAAGFHLYHRLNGILGHGMTITETLHANDLFYKGSLRDKTLLKTYMRFSPSSAKFRFDTALATLAAAHAPEYVAIKNKYKRNEEQFKNLLIVA